MKKTKIGRRQLGVLATGAAAVAMTARPASAAGKTIKYVRNGNLAQLDPIWTTAYVTRDHGYMIYDVLFALDAKLQVQPQMVDTWKVSDDKLTYTFVLRDGLKDAPTVKTAIIGLGAKIEAVGADAGRDLRRGRLRRRRGRRTPPGPRCRAVRRVGGRGPRRARRRR